MQRYTEGFVDFVPNFSMRDRRAGLQKGTATSFSVRTSPPAAKLGAGVEKSPGPSLFYALSWPAAAPPHFMGRWPVGPRETSPISDLPPIHVTPPSKAGATGSGSSPGSR